MKGPIPQYDERIHRMTRAGMGAVEIARELSISPRTVHRARKRLQVAQPAPTSSTRDEREFAKQLLDDGASREEVARTIDRSATAVKRWFPGVGWVRADGSRFARLKGKP